MAELVRRPAGQVPALDALRAAAILLVVGHHWAVKEYRLAGGLATPLQDFPLFYYGWAGVDLFFVLSGYLIGQQLWKELDRTGTIHVGRFLLRRGLRIWPLYYFMLVYYLFVNDAIFPRWSNWVFLSNYIGGGMARTWSLSTEEQFYLAVPALLLLVGRRIPLRGYLWVLLAIEAVVLGVRHDMLTDLAAAGIDPLRRDYVAIYPFHTHLEGLLAGLIIALLSVTAPSVFRRDHRGISWLGLMTVAGGTAVALSLRVVNQRLFSFLVLGLIFGSLTFWALCDRSWLTRPLASRVFYPVSRLSYGMYLNHLWALPVTNRWLVTGARGVSGDPAVVFLLSLAGATVVSIAFAALTFVLIEHPFLLLRDRVLAATKRVATSASAAPAPGPAVGDVAGV